MPASQDVLDSYRRQLTDAQQAAFDLAAQALHGQLPTGTTEQDLLSTALYTDFLRHRAIHAEVHETAVRTERNNAVLAEPSPWAALAQRELLSIDLLTAHPTHTRDAAMRAASEQLYGALDGRTRDAEPPQLDRLIPPAHGWTKPSLVHDEMPMLAQAAARQAVAFMREWEALPSAEARARLERSTARPHVWGAYDQDGHPDAYAGAMLLQRAHLRKAMWAMYAQQAAQQGLERAALSRIDATRDYWSAVVDWHTTHQPALAAGLADDNRTRLAQPLADTAFDFSRPAVSGWRAALTAYPADTGKLGQGESEATETAALKALLAGHPALLATAGKHGTTGGAGQYRFTATGSRGLFDKDGVTLREQGERDLQLRAAEIRALGSDLGTVIIAECDDPAQYRKTIDVMDKSGVNLWINQQTPGDAGVVVMPLIETPGVSAKMAAGAGDMLRAMRAQGLQLPARIDFMKASSDMTVRAGRVGEQREQMDLALAVAALDKEFGGAGGVRFCITDGTGGSTVRGGGAIEMEQLRAKARPQLFAESAQTVQGRKIDAVYGHSDAARAHMRQKHALALSGTSDIAQVEAMQAFLVELDGGVGKRAGKPIGTSAEYTGLFAPSTNPMIDAVMGNRRDGSRVPKDGTGSKGMGPDGERAISWTKMVRAAGLPLPHNSWLEVGNETRAQFARSLHDENDPRHHLCVYLAAELALDATRVDLRLADRMFPDGRNGAPALTEQARDTIAHLKEVHRDNVDFLRALGVLAPDSDAHPGLLVPSSGPIRDALRGELGLRPTDSDAQLIDALKARANAAHLQAGLCEMITGARPVPPAADGSAQPTPAQLRERLNMLQYGSMRVNSTDGPGAPDLGAKFFERIGLPLHDIPADAMLSERTGIAHDGSITLSRDGVAVLSADGAVAHESLHERSLRAKDARQRDLADPYASVRASEAGVQRNAAAGTAARTYGDYITALKSEAAIHAQVDPSATAAPYAQALLALAEPQAQLTHRKLDRLQDFAAGTPSQALTLDAETARQQEKLAHTELQRAAIGYLTPDAAAQVREALSQQPQLSNHARFFLGSTTGGLLGVPSHGTVTGKAYEETRAFYGATTPADRAALAAAMPAVATALRVYDSAHRTTEAAQARLLAGHENAATLSAAPPKRQATL